MGSSKRNPLLRNNNEEFNKVIGSLGNEIEDQDLGNLDGGTGTAEISAATAISAFTAWVHDKITATFNCGNVFTASAECNLHGRSCK